MASITSYPLTFAENYYIHIEGYVYKHRKEQKLIPFYSKNNGLHVKINDKDYSLLNLMIEYFGYNKKGYFKVKVKRNRITPLQIPYRHIVFCYDESHINRESSDDLLCDKYRCASKARTANNRATIEIDKHDVLSVLKKADFKCHYCGVDLEKHNWHLEHIKPISDGGNNDFENLTAACKTCNLMKHNMNAHNFIIKCRVIAGYRKDEYRKQDV